MVSEVSFPRFWGVLSIAKWSPFFVSVIGSAVSDISQFARFPKKSPSHPMCDGANNLMTKFENGTSLVLCIDFLAC